MNSLEIYEKHHKLIHLIYNSRLKIQILLTLIGGNAPLSRLREVTGSTSQALIPKIRNLEALSLIESVNYEYCLTPIGRLVAESIENYVSLMGGIDKHQAFLISHDLSDIPHEFLRRISDLYLAEVKYDATTDIFFVYRHYVDILKDARYIHGISSAISPVLATFLAEKVAQGVPVELVVNRNVVETLKQEPYISNIRELLGSGDFRLFVTEESLKLGLTVSDKFVSLGFYKLGTDQYDTSTDLFSDDPQALAWAEELFTYFRERAQPLDLNQLLTGTKS
jgi:predicted transcriptional regulator